VVVDPWGVVFAHGGLIGIRAHLVGDLFAAQGEAGA